jgi:hypothetical protein
MISKAGMIITLVMTVIFSQSAYRNDGQVRLAPRLLNYQGYLTDTQGNPITNPSVSMTFAIFDAVSAGNQKWSEAQSTVAVEKGIFNVLLGSITSIPDSVFTNSTNRWLQLTVAGQVLSPRTQIVSSPYSYTSTYSDTAVYARNSAPDNDWTLRITDGADTTLQMGGRWGLARAGSVLFGNADSTHINLGVASNTGYSGQNYKYCTVAGGYFNAAGYRGATVAGGDSNTAGATCASVGGGLMNTANNSYATIGGGYGDTASGMYAIVSGGRWNKATASLSTVSGGSLNIATGIASAINGGTDNNASGYLAMIGGGQANTASDTFSFVGGGYSNTAGGDHSVVSGGYNNVANGVSSTVGGGFVNQTFGSHATVAGGEFNAANGLDAAVGGGRENRAGGSYASVGGGWSNNAGDYGTVGGGYDNYSRYSASVTGGYQNSAESTYATACGGLQNHASGFASFVGGGSQNVASGTDAAVLGGSYNLASGIASSVGGGGVNYAIGDYSVVAGGAVDSVAARYGYAANYSTKVDTGHTNSAAFTTSHTIGINQVRAAAFSTGTMNFAMDFPHDPMNKILNQYAIGSDEVLLKYSGSIILNTNGRATVDLPDYFDDINRNPRIQLTGVGSSDVYVAEDITGNRFVIGGNPNTKVYWEVTGERKDIHAEIARLQTPVVQEKRRSLRNHSIDDDAMIGMYDGLHQINPELFKFKTDEGRSVHEQSKQLLPLNE